MKGKKLTALAITACHGYECISRNCSGGSAESGKETKKTADGKTELELFSTKAENKRNLTETGRHLQRLSG